MKVKKEIIEMLQIISDIMKEPLVKGATIVITDTIVITAHITVSAYGYKSRVIVVMNTSSQATLEIAYGAATKEKIEAAVKLLQ